MDFAELIFAAEVRKLALIFRQDAWTEFAATSDVIEAARGEYGALRDVKHQWEARNAVAMFVPNALKQMQETALQVRSLMPG